MLPGTVLVNIYLKRKEVNTGGGVVGGGGSRSFSSVTW